MIYRDCENPKCLFCAHSASIATTDDMVCSKRGIVNQDSKCKKFRYDPQKRTPRRKPKLDTDKFKKEDFEL